MEEMLQGIVRRLLRQRYPTVRQYDRTDCGAASLLSVLRYHGGDASLVTVRELSNTGVEGTSMWSLQRASESLGFEASGARGSYEDLIAASLPCVAHLVLEDGRPHFAVVYRATAKKVLVGDPASGLHWTTKKRFCARWKSRAVLLLKPTDRLHHTPAPHWLAWVLKYFRREETWLTQALFMGFVYSGLGLLTALFVRALIDRFIPSGNVGSIVALGAGLLVFQLVRSGTGYLRSWLLIELSRRVNTFMTQDTLSHLFRLPSSFFESRRTGDITARLNDSVRIHAAILTVLGSTAIDVVVVLGSLAILFYIAAPFAWVALGFVSILCFVVTWAARQVRDQQFKVKQSYAAVQASYIDSIGAIDSIRGANSASVFGTLLGHMYEYVQEGLARLGIVQTRVSASVELVTGGLIVFALTTGSVLVVRNSMTLGAMMAAYSLLAGVAPAAARIFEAHLQIQEATVASMRLLDLLLVQPERESGQTKFRMSSGLVVQEGGFAWQNDKTMLANVNLEIPRGRITALCGPSGVGKSTLVKILDRRYDLQEGRLLVDETPAEEIDLYSYRRHVATLPEFVSIINGTIADNILLGRRAQSHQQLLDRIESMGLSRFMSRFPNGVFTFVGEDGRRISSGEQQTIGLLRALWDTPDVLLVDEGMNAVDAEISQLFSKTLRTHAGDHAVLIVSHQPRTLLTADFVYVLETGRIAEAGAPDELMGADSAFASLILADATAAQSA